MPSQMATRSASSRETTSHGWYLDKQGALFFDLNSPGKAGENNVTEPGRKELWLICRHNEYYTVI